MLFVPSAALCDPAPAATPPTPQPQPTYAGAIQYDQIWNLTSAAPSPDPSSVAANIASMNQMAAAGELLSNDAIKFRYSVAQAHLAGSQNPFGAHGGSGSLFLDLLAVIPGAGQISAAIATVQALKGMAGGVAHLTASSSADRAAVSAIAKAQTALEEEHTHGKLTHRTFYHGWQRIDDVAGQMAVVVKPDLGQVIILDLLNKRYAVSTSHIGYLVNPVQATGSMDEHTTTTLTNIGNATVGGSAAIGIKSSTVGQLSSSTGSCDASQTWGPETDRIDYFSTQYADPQLSFYQAVVAAMPCRMTITRNYVGDPATPSLTKLALYSYQSFSSGASPLALIVERGNVAPVDDSAAALFEIPADFTQDAAMADKQYFLQ
jgi:hypothetical protein